MGQPGRVAGAAERGRESRVQKHPRSRFLETIFRRQRSDRIGLVRPRRTGYAREELVAELGAAFVSATIGIKLHDREDHAAYLASWLQALRNDKKCIFTAARLAQDASDWLLSRMAVENAADMDEAAA